MPDSDNRELELPLGDAPEATEPEAPPAPSYVAADEFKQFRDTITGNFSALQGVIESLRDTVGMVASQASRPAPSSPAPGGGVSEEEVEHAVSTGDFKTLKKYLDQREAAFQQREILPLRVSGTEAISNAVGSMAMSRLPYAQRFEKEIRQYIGNLPPEMRMHEQAYRIAHDAIVGANVDKIVEEKVAEQLRAASAPKPEPLQGGGRAGRTTTTGQTPTVEDFAGAEGRAALQMVGLDEDAFVRKLGYRDWSDYMAAAYGKPNSLSKPGVGR